MDFNQLLSKMQELDAPATESMTDECGMQEMPGQMSPPMTPPMPAPEKDKARMNINISAEGDAIDDVLKLMTKVNPDMINQPEKPTPLTPPPSPMDMDMDMDEPKIIPINKLLPDFDGDNDDKPGGEMDMPTDYDKDGDLDAHEKDHDDEMKLHKTVDRDNDGDHDMDDHDMEKDDKKEAFANEPGEDYQDIEYLIKKLAGGMNREKGTHPKVAGGDNPMQAMEAEEKVEESMCSDCECDPCECDKEDTNESLRAQIRTELLARLEEAKGAK